MALYSIGNQNLALPSQLFRKTFKDEPLFEYKQQLAHKLNISSR
jgi:hypothetical protein